MRLVKVFQRELVKGRACPGYEWHHPIAWESICNKNGKEESYYIVSWCSPLPHPSQQDWPWNCEPFLKLWSKPLLHCVVFGRLFCHSISKVTNTRHKHYLSNISFLHVCFCRDAFIQPTAITVSCLPLNAYSQGWHWIQICGGYYRNCMPPRAQ